MKYLKITIVIATILILITALMNNNTEYTNDFENITILFCPTMKIHLDNTSIDNANLKKVMNTQKALEKLNTGEGDLALVGRLKRPFELNDHFRELILFNRYTIASNERFALDEKDLAKIDVHTYLLEEKLKEFNLNFVFHKSKENAMRDGEIFLIPWNDFDENLELVNVMQGQNKVEKYRNPVIYYNEEKEQLAKKLYKKIKKYDIN